MDLDDEELKATRMMNGADRKGRVNKMEQDIKILEDYIYNKKETMKEQLVKAIESVLKERQQDKEKIKELEESNQEKAKMLTEQNRNLQISYDSLQELFELRKYKNSSIPVSLVEEKILNPMKEEHDKAIKGFIKRDIPQCIEDGGIAQELGYFIGKIEELLEKRK